MIKSLTLRLYNSTASLDYSRQWSIILLPEKRFVNQHLQLAFTVGIAGQDNETQIYAPIRPSSVNTQLYGS